MKKFISFTPPLYLISHFLMVFSTFFVFSFIIMHVWYFIHPQQTIKAPHKNQSVGAFIRLKNEIRTVQATLNSIDGVFDRYVIIHSDEQDDGSIAIADKWCRARPGCTRYVYPYVVVRPHEKKTIQNYSDKNSLAAYYQFGLEKFKPEEWLVKIDMDQVYIKDRLKELVRRIKTEYPRNDHTLYAMRGYNTFVRKGRLVKHKHSP